MLLLYDPAWSGSWGWGQMEYGASPAMNQDGVLIFRAAPLTGPVPPQSKRGEDSFLADCLSLLTSGEYDSCTIVGLDTLPLHHLAELGLSDAETELASSDERRWVDTVAERVREFIQADGLYYADDLDYFNRIEVLTMDEYRTRVGEERFRLTTFSDGIPPHMDP